MTKCLSMRTAALAMAMLASGPVIAWAQSNPAASTPATSPAAAASAPKAAAGAAAADTAVQARVEARIKQLHTQLKITPDEEPQWSQFAETMRANAREVGQQIAERAGKVATMTALEDMQSYAQLAQTHAEHLQKLMPAFEALYNAMPTPQKQTADQVFRAGQATHTQASSQ